jgi:hypothetical protein
MSISRFVIVAGILSAWTWLHPGRSIAAGEKTSGALTVAEFEKLHKELQPPADELWRSIPWHVSIVEAQHAAAKNGKPIFVWVASGEPLGCG